ncbi:uncharacterized protein [Nicotiana tomentosiformis]|uniref:uncharacterized protein n=1 Tax=Nicotiana tomentosiformis TaxID=4098 RepID=UPI00388CA29F
MAWLSVLFLEMFVQQTRREELRRHFEQLHQEDMPVTQYEMRFSELAHHAVWLVPTERERIRRFIDGLNYGLCFVMTQEIASSARFYEVVDIDRRLEQGDFISEGPKNDRKGCLAYLDFVRDVGADNPTIDSVLVVGDFPNIFPADLSIMPPNRDIDFSIDLVSGTQPISTPAYRMALTKLKELKEQLQEIFHKGFIRPSVSPWGASILFVKKMDGTIRMCIDY